MSTIQKSKSKTKDNQTKVKFLRLPMDDMTVNFLAEIQSDNPYFSQLDALRYVIGRHIKNSSRDRLLLWLQTNLGSKSFPELTEDQIFELSKDI